MTLPGAPDSYNLRDENNIRRILAEGFDGMARRLFELEQAPPPVVEPPGTGRPFGAFALYASNTTLKNNSEWFNWTNGPVDPNNIQARLDTADNLGLSVSFFLAGGDKSSYVSGSPQRFDKVKWKNRVTAFNTQAIKDRVWRWLDEHEGQDLFFPTIDEAYHPDWDRTVSGAQCIAGNGIMTKTLLDELADHIHSIFGTGPDRCPPIGHHGGPIYSFDPNRVFTVTDYVGYQWQWNTEVPNVDDGDIDGWILGAKAQHVKDGTKPIYSMNLLNGGVKQENCCRPVDNCTTAQKVGCCPTPLTGGVGIGAGAGGQNCKMSASNVSEWGVKLLNEGNALGLWQWDETFMSRADNQAAFSILEQHASTLAPRSSYRA